MDYTDQVLRDPQHDDIRSFGAASP